MAGIYLHFPFCKSKCNYCDFYSKIDLTNSEILVKHEISELILRSKYIDKPVRHLYLKFEANPCKYQNI